MSTKNDFSGEYETPLWRKSVAEREGIEKSPVMIEKIKTAERELDRATQLYESFIL